MTTHIKFTVPSVVVVDGHIINCWRVMTTDYDIVLFLSTASISSKLRLTVPPTGAISNCDICDIQAFFDILEVSEEDHHQRLAERLTEGIDNPTGDDGKPPVRYDEVRHDINIKRVPSGMLIRLLKNVMIALDEEVYLNATDARQLRRKYGRTTTTNKSNKGFGI